MTDEYHASAKAMARILLEAVQRGEREALSRLERFSLSENGFRRSDAENVIAREEGFADWTDFASACADGTATWRKAVRRLRTALFYGQQWKVRQLISRQPGLAHADFGIEVALHDSVAVRERLSDDPDLAVRKVENRAPILHLCFSRHRPDPESNHTEVIAEALFRNGADINDGMPAEPGSEHLLSALYGAIGHAGNLPLAEWLLRHGANPNDNESLYHATELGHAEGVRLLLNFEARIDGTNAINRALDFNSHEMVQLLLAAGGDPNEKLFQHPGGQPPLVIPALHQAARRHCDRKMAGILLHAGADPTRTHCGHTAYALARIYGNSEFADALAEHGGFSELSPEEALLAAVANGPVPAGAEIDTATLSDETRFLICNLVSMPERLPHLQRLAALGSDPNQADAMGTTPLHLAGWEGIADTLLWLLDLGPDLDHINDYGGNLLSTIIHGSENCPARGTRQHIRCAEIALAAGARLSTRAIELAGDEQMSEFLSDWSLNHPDQVIPGGIG